MQREITQELVKQLLPERRADSNKGSYGSVLAAAGSMAYRGAAALCTEGGAARRRRTGLSGQRGACCAAGAGPHT